LLRINGYGSKDATEQKQQDKAAHKFSFVSTMLPNYLYTTNRKCAPVSKYKGHVKKRKREVESEKLSAALQQVKPFYAGGWKPSG
jgi:hypothetical protein